MLRVSHPFSTRFSHNILTAAAAAYNCTTIRTHLHTHHSHTARLYINTMHALVQPSIAKQTFLREHKHTALCAVFDFPIFITRIRYENLCVQCDLIYSQSNWEVKNSAHFYQNYNFGPLCRFVLFSSRNFEELKRVIPRVRQRRVKRFFCSIPRFVPIQSYWHVIGNIYIFKMLDQS